MASTSEKLSHFLRTLIHSIYESPGNDIYCYIPTDKFKLLKHDYPEINSDFVYENKDLFSLYGFVFGDPPTFFKKDSLQLKYNGKIIINDSSPMDVFMRIKLWT